jgi:hypothetical protein
MSHVCQVTGGGAGAPPTHQDRPLEPRTDTEQRGESWQGARRTVRRNNPHVPWAGVTTPLVAWAGLCLACAGEPSPETTADDLGFDEIVYVVRQHTVIDDRGGVRIDVAGGMGQVMDHGRYVPGGRIEVRNLATGAVRNLLEGSRFARADIDGLDVSFDARHIVFAMKLSGGDHYHIYTASLSPGTDAENPYGIQQLTFGDRDDFHPVWVAGGRIAFVTTQPYTEMGRRADEYNHARQVPQIATITLAGGDADRKLCSQNLSNTFNLFSMRSGQIGFSRWEHLENVNDAKLFAMNPDCTQMVALSGQHGKDGYNSLVQVVETSERNVFIGIGTNRENTIQGGAIIRIDARSRAGDHRHDEERATVASLTPAVPKGEEASAIGRYRTPVELPDGRLLVSWADGPVNELNEISLTPPDWGLYVYDPETRRNTPIHNVETEWEIFGRPVLPRPEPPVLSSVQNSQDATIPLRLGSIDIRKTSLGELHRNVVTGAQFDRTPIDEALTHSVKVRIIEGFSSEAAPGVTMFGLTMAEGAAIVGEAHVHEDGSWLADVPPFLPYHLQAVDEFELAIRNQTTWIQGMPGEARVCGGCHEERTGPNAPSGQPLPLANTAEDFMRPIADRLEYPWAHAPESPNEIQKILDARCVSCHDEQTHGAGPQEFYTVGGYTLPRLDLSSRPITVTYDNDVAAYPASYVSLFYPAALAMEMGMGAIVTGEVPPHWAIPSDARNSLLIEKLNMTSAFDPSRTAWLLGEPFSHPGVRGGERTLHPEDVGGELTREERAALIRAIDLGGQYYSRQNTGFVPDGNNVLSGAAREY